MKNCLQCDSEFLNLKGRGSPRRYCSVKCKTKAHNYRNRLKRCGPAKVLEQKHCYTCNVLYMPNGFAQKFCGAKCAKFLTTPALLHPNIKCLRPTCPKEARVGRGIQGKWCSDTCQKWNQRRGKKHHRTERGKARHRVRALERRQTVEGKRIERRKRIQRQQGFRLSEEDLDLWQKQVEIFGREKLEQIRANNERRIKWQKELDRRTQLHKNATARVMENDIRRELRRELELRRIDTFNQRVVECQQKHCARLGCTNLVRRAVGPNAIRAKWCSTRCYKRNKYLMSRGQHAEKS